MKPWARTRRPSLIFRRCSNSIPKFTEAYHLRGCVQFKLGKFSESVADFDKYLEKNPNASRSHWQRGISCYYAGKYDEGRQQFEGYQTFDSNDVENAVWRFMCQAKKDDIAKCRKDMLKIGDDQRVPMKEVYDLFMGKIEPKDVLAAAKERKTVRDQDSPLFYAHLYLGLYFETMGDKKQALEHLNKATDEYPPSPLHVGRGPRASGRVAPRAGQEVIDARLPFSAMFIWRPAIMAEQTWTLGSLLDWTAKHLAQKNVESPRLDAEILLAHAVGCKRIDLYGIRFAEVASPEVRQAFRQLIGKRLEGCPVAYLVGKKEFYNLELEVSPAVLIPRPDSELVVAECVKLAKPLAGPRIVDIGTGSGNLAIAVAKYLPGASGHDHRQERRGPRLGSQERSAARRGRADPFSRGRSVRSVAGRGTLRFRAEQPALHSQRRHCRPGHRRARLRTARGSRRRP